jgi:N-acetylglucosamine kinase-like BadF-type ATPase
VNIDVGVDGGGSGTALCLVTATGEVLAHTDAPSCYYLDAGSGEGVSLAERVLAEAVARICSVAGIQPAPPVPS